jgi:hypothetical protein
MKTTYKNKQNTTMIRKCGNCKNYKLLEEKDNMGYCQIMNLYFAFTHDKSVYAIVKDFYICENHEFVNEEILKQQSQVVELLPYLIERNQRKKGQ